MTVPPTDEPREPADDETPALTAALQRRVGRRSLIAGAGVAGAAALAGAGVWLRGQGGAPNIVRTPHVAAQAQPTATPSPTAGVRAPDADGIPAGMALVSSPRLPLFGVGPNDVPRLLGGKIKDWRDVGSAIALKVEPLALAKQVPAGMTPAATFADYEKLVAGLGQHLGGVAVIPLDQVDYRVNVLSVGGVDPLRHAEDANNPIFSIAVVGDIVPGRNVNNKMIAYNDYTHPFHKIADTLASFDLIFANLEGNLSNTIQPPSDPHTFTFVSSPKMLDGFKEAGIDAVTLANNHSAWNDEGWGLQPLLDTIDALDNAGIPYFGAGHTLDRARRAWNPTVKNMSIAVLGIDGVTANEDQNRPGVVAGNVAAGSDQPGTNPYQTDQFVADIQAAAQQADIVIPYFHFGVEYQGVLPDWALQGARAAVDAGATMVVTNHPHVVQGMEDYKGAPIVYSVGNFIFDQMFSAGVREGMIMELTFRGKKVAGLRFHCVEIEDFNQPRLMTAGEQASLMDRFWWSVDRIAAGA